MKNKQVVLRHHLTKKLLHSKRDHQQSEKQIAEWGKCLQTTYLLKDEYQKFIKNTYNSTAKKKNLSLKMGKGLELTLL